MPSYLFILTLAVTALRLNGWTTVPEFEIAAAHALTNRDCLVDAAFTNQLAAYALTAANPNDRLSAETVHGVCEMELFQQTMELNHLTNCLNVATNVFRQAEATPDSWVRWQSQMLEFSAYASLNDMTKAYLVASNAWQSILSSNFVDSTNAVSQAFKCYFKVGGMTIRESVCYAKAVTAVILGRTSEAQTLKSQLPLPYRRNVEELLSSQNR